MGKEGSHPFLRPPFRSPKSGLLKNASLRESVMMTCTFVSGKRFSTVCQIHRAPLVRGMRVFPRSEALCLLSDRPD